MVIYYSKGALGKVALYRTQVRLPPAPHCAHTRQSDLGLSTVASCTCVCVSVRVRGSAQWRLYRGLSTPLLSGPRPRSGTVLEYGRRAHTGPTI